MYLTSLLCYACSDLSYNYLVGSFPSWVSQQNLQLYVCYCLLHCLCTVFEFSLHTLFNFPTFYNLQLLTFYLPKNHKIKQKKPRIMKTGFHSLSLMMKTVTLQ